MKFVYDDGGRAAAGYKGTMGDCVVRAIAIATQQPYTAVYEVLSHGQRTMRRSKHTTKAATKGVATGVYTRRKWFKEYMRSIGWEFVPTMGIGTGCRVHLYNGELPNGRLVVAVSKHYTAVIDQVIHDTHDPQREAHMIEPDRGQPLKPGQWRNENGVCSIVRRCVYGYWRKAEGIVRVHLF